MNRDWFVEYMASRRSQNGIDSRLVITLAGIVFVIVVIWCIVAALLIGIGCPGTGLLVAALIGIVWYKSRAARIREQRALAGYCIHCGYDLRSSPVRCPECGNDVSDESLRRRRIYDEIVKARGGPGSPKRSP